MDNLSKKKGVCSDSKFFSTISGMILNRSQPKLQQNLLQMKCNIESQEETCVDSTSFHFWFKEFFEQFAQNWKLDSKDL